MPDPKLYLGQDVRVEPLINSWYAWPLLIPPATASMHLANAQVPIMESYVAEPEKHLNAAKTGTALGAPVMTYDRIRADEVAELLHRTVEQRAHLIDLACAVRTLDRRLQSEGDGRALEPLYPEVPDCLRGYVELGYDLNNQASVRFLEALLYRSRFYCPDAQSFALDVVVSHSRPAALNTPRLEADAKLTLTMPFRDASVDFLYSLKRHPSPFGEILERLGLRNGQSRNLHAMLTEARPADSQERPDSGVRIRYFGHACALVEWRGTSVLVDPLINYRYQGERHWYAFDDLPEKIDYALITHAHEDHLHLETLLAIRRQVGTVVVPRNGGGQLHDPSMRLLLETIGFPRVIEVEDMDVIECDGGRIVALPFFGEHGDLGIRTKASYLIEASGHRVLYVADSSNLEPRLYEIVRQVVGEVDALFIGMECDGSPMSSLYGPLLTHAVCDEHNQARRFRGSDCAQAMEAVRCLGCRHVYVYAMGLEPWLYYLMSLQYTETSRPIVESNHLVEQCRARGIESERLYWAKEIMLA